VDEASRAQRTSVALGSENATRAILQRGYGGLEVLQLADMERPAVGDGDLLVRVPAASANPLDWHYMRGEPLIMRTSSGLRQPKRKLIGVDFTGTVEAVGSNVARFTPGTRGSAGESERSPSMCQFRKESDRAQADQRHV